MAGRKKSTDPVIEQTTIRVAAYLRYSSHHQDGNTSIDVQRDAIKAWAERQINPKAAVVHEYVDEARSGRNVAKRTALQELQADAHNKKFDVVLVSAHDRLGRNQEEINAVRSFIRDDCGVEIRAANGLSAHDGVQGLMYERFEDMNSERYSLDLSAKFKAGINRIWKDGWFIGSKRPYGYQRVRVSIDRDRYNHHIYRSALEIIPSEADAVRWLFEQYATGKYSNRQLADMMNDNGFTTTSGKKFGSNSVNSILENLVYAGINTHQVSRSNRAGTKHYHDQPINETQGRHKPIISRELYDTVQAIKHHRSSNAAHVRQHNYTLQGLVWCWHCFNHRHQVVGDHKNFGKTNCFTSKPNSKPVGYYRCISPRKVILANRVAETLRALINRS